MRRLLDLLGGIGGEVGGWRVVCVQKEKDEKSCYFLPPSPELVVLVFVERHIYTPKHPLLSTPNFPTK